MNILETTKSGVGPGLQKEDLFVDQTTIKEIGQNPKPLLSITPSRTKVSALLVLAIGLALCNPNPSVARIETQYKKRVDPQNIERGEWHEGVLGKPIAGKTGRFDLISVLAGYRDTPTDTLPPNLKLKFFLKEQGEVFLRIREPAYQYWLDQVKPKEPWQVGFGNTFTWSSKTVLRKLNKRMDLYELGAVVRLGYKKPAPVERVAPAILFHKTPPQSIDSYVFTLKASVLSKVTSFVKKRGATSTFSREGPRFRSGGVPFSVTWKAKGMEPGFYMLYVEGKPLTSPKKFEKRIHFYHQPDINE